MTEIGKLGGNTPPATPNTANQNAANATGAPIGQPGTLGQPTGMPIPAAPAGTQILSDVLAGRDASQLLAAEQMRGRGGASAVEQQLGLNLQPSMLGGIAPPPGNLEALRHLTPTMRRALMREMLEKQRKRMKTLAGLVQRERDANDDEQQENQPDERRESIARALPEGSLNLSEERQTRARDELMRAARMLDLLDEMLVMQDYTISQMGTFSQG